MRWPAMIVGISLGLPMALPAGAQAPQAPRPKPRLIRSAGCVRHGVEPGCLVVRGFRDNKEYTLYFTGEKKPDVGTAISFEGKLHSGPTTCMQGTAVAVTSWSTLRANCYQKISPKTIEVTGKLVSVAGIGGETTGWAIELESEFKMDGKQVKTIELNHPTKNFERLENRFVAATGRLGFWFGVERGYWPVLEITTIREVKSR